MPSMLAVLSALGSWRWIVTRTESPTLISASASGASIVTVGLPVLLEVCEDGDPAVGMVVAVGIRVSQPATSAIAPVRAARRTKVCRIGMTPEPDDLAVLGR